MCIHIPLNKCNTYLRLYSEIRELLKPCICLTARIMEESREEFVEFAEGYENSL